MNDGQTVFMRRWVFSTDNGPVSLQLPSPMTPEDFEIFEQWIALMLRVEKRKTSEHQAVRLGVPTAIKEKE